jgi:NADH-quinone oxidoreductase subunit C
MTGASALTHEQVHERLAAKVPGLSFVPAAPGVVPSTIVPPEQLLAVCRMLRDDPELKFDYPGSITAIDYLDYFEIVYQLRSFTHHHDVNLKCRTEREVATVPSVVPVWPGADFQEREIYDLMGVTFTGHPNPTRILLWDEFEGHPLRKDFGIPAPMPADVELGLHRGQDVRAFEGTPEAH